MAVKFLDYTGLGYFWSKIKAWCNATFAAITHNQASNTINSMTGYSKPSSGSAIAASDSLNSAIGKLEAKVDNIDDSNYVHKTDDETIDGIKTFRANSQPKIILRNTSLTKGVNPDSTVYSTIALCDAETTEWVSSINNGRLGVIQSSVYNTGRTEIAIATYSNNLTDSVSAAIIAEVDANGIPVGRAPSTSSNRTTGTDIITRDWLNGSNSGVVHTTGNESIAGTKTFTSNIVINKNSPALIEKDSDVTRGVVPSSSIYRNLFIYCGTADDSIYKFYNTISKNSGNWFSILVYPISNTNNTFTRLDVGYDDNGVAFAVAPSTSTSRTDRNDIVTRGFLEDKEYTTATGHTHSYLPLSGGIITGGINFKRSVTKGTAPSSKTYFGYDFTDTNNTRMALFECNYATDKSSYIGLYAYNTTITGSEGNIGSIGIGCDSSGKVYAHAPTADASSNATNIATTAWVRTFCDTTQKYMKAVSVTGSGNAITTASLSNGTLTLTKGSTFLTSHQSLSNYVTLNSAQSISAVKTFTQSPIISRDNPYLFFDETDVARGSGVTADHSSYAGLVFRDKNDKETGYVVGRFYGGLTEKHYCILFQANDGTSASSTKGSQVNLMCWNTGVHSFNSDPTNDVLLGTSGRKWKEVWCTQSSLNSSSDERLKSNITNLSDNVLDAWEDVSWVQYQFNDAIKEKGKNARLHVGTIAQSIDRIFKSRNLDIAQYGLFLYDEWGETPEAFDKNGNIIQHYQAAGNEYGIRYVEALCMEAAYQRRKNKILENRISELERQVSDMLQILQSLKGAN